MDRQTYLIQLHRIERALYAETLSEEKTQAEKPAGPFRKGLVRGELA